MERAYQVPIGGVGPFGGTQSCPTDGKVGEMRANAVITQPSARPITDLLWLVQ